MSHTLQRKMFKAPGSAAHGGGLTSGLELRTNYNKGGSVTTPIGVGSGNQPMVPGPDGKMREAHLLPVFLGGAGMAGIGSGLLRLLAPQALRVVINQWYPDLMARCVKHMLFHFYLF